MAKSRSSSGTTTKKKTRKKTTKKKTSKRKVKKPSKKKTSKKVAKKSSNRKVRKPAKTKVKKSPKKTRSKKTIKKINKKTSKKKSSKRSVRKTASKSMPTPKPKAEPVLIHPHSQKLKHVLKESHLAAIVSACLILPALFLGYLLSTSDAIVLKLTNFIIIAITLIADIYVLRGYYAISERHRTKFMKVMVYFVLILSVLTSIFATITLFSEPAKYYGIVILAILLISGIVYALFGLSMWRLRKMIPGFLTSICILYVFTGIAYASLHLMLLTPILGLVISILEAVTFHRLSQHY